MADAGKVAILPRGLWSAETVYEPLDLIYYNNNSFVALKESVGVTPVDGDTWMLSLSGINQVTIDAILNGTQQVGDSAKLGGKDASEYALGVDLAQVDGSGAVLTTSILEKAIEVDVGIHVYRLGGGYYTGGDLPAGAYHYTVAEIEKRLQDEIVVTLSGIYSNNDELSPPIFNMYNGTSWSGWKTYSTTDDLADYFKNTGGKIDGNVTVESKDAVSRLLRLKNSKREIYQEVDANGTYFSWDKTNARAIFQSLFDGTNTFNGTLTTKPTGTYTGNGSATTRTIATNGIGSFVLIFRGANSFALLSQAGYIAFNGTSVVCGTDAYFSTGKIYISSTSEIFNASGVNYKYQVL